MKKTPSTVGQIKNIFQEVDVCATNETSLVFIDNETDGKSSRKDSELFPATLSAHIQPNVSNLIGQPNGFIIQRSGMLCNVQVNHLT